MTTRCISGDKFRIKYNNDAELTAYSSTENVCTATKILDRLHREFTEKYNTGNSNQTSNPTFYLRKQPKLSSFFNEPNDGQEINRFNNMLTMNEPKIEADQQYRTTIYGIMNGEYNGNIGIPEYSNPTTTIKNLKDLNNPNSFKGIYGLIELNNIIQNSIDNELNSMSGNEQQAKDAADARSNIENKYAERKGIQTTLQAIAVRENEIYREKFLNLILMVVGIFIVGTQLVNKYFSFGGGSDVGSSGGGLFGNLFTGFGLGASSGIFSRFGGLGLGRSGRSRITGLFSNNPYALSTR